VSTIPNLDTSHAARNRDERPQRLQVLHPLRITSIAFHSAATLRMQSTPAPCRAASRSTRRHVEGSCTGDKPCEQKCDHSMCKTNIISNLLLQQKEMKLVFPEFVKTKPVCLGCHWRTTFDEIRAFSAAAEAGNPNYKKHTGGNFADGVSF
jgi:hypothetical protein